MSLLEVRNLEVRFAMRKEELTALKDVSFTLEKGERLGIVGESGAGKSVAAFSILNLISKPGAGAGPLFYRYAYIATPSKPPPKNPKQWHAAYASAHHGEEPLFSRLYVAAHYHLCQPRNIGKFRIEMARPSRGTRSTTCG